MNVMFTMKFSSIVMQGKKNSEECHIRFFFVNALKSWSIVYQASFSCIANFACVVCRLIGVLILMASSIFTKLRSLQWKCRIFLVNSYLILNTLFFKLRLNNNPKQQFRRNWKYLHAGKKTVINVSCKSCKFTRII